MGFVAKWFSTELNSLFDKAKSDFVSIIPLLTSSGAIVIYLILAGIAYTGIIIALGIKIKKTLENKKRIAKELEKEKQEVTNLLKINIKSLNSEKAKDLLSKLHECDDRKFPKINDKLNEIKKRIEEAETEERVWNLRNEEAEIISSIKEKKDELEERIQSVKEKNQKILNKLDAFITQVYKRDELNEEEINALKTIGFTEENEFCILERRRINILINPHGNQTVQHAFLVWSVQRLLEKNRKASRIISKDSVEADITFEFGGKTFAIEVEVGSLLRKPEQLKSKLGSLKRKYSDRWIFLVSNKKLYSEYKKFGLTSTRADFAKKLGKLLKSS